MNDTRLVYSTDPARNQVCPKCKNLVPECVCSREEPISGSVTAVLRIEKSGRKGKIVTVIDRLPANENYLKNLAKKLKGQCGSGGTFFIEEKKGVIEIQGNMREQIRQFLEKENVKVKG